MVLRYVVRCYLRRGIILIMRWENLHIHTQEVFGLVSGKSTIWLLFRARVVCPRLYVQGLDGIILTYRSVPLGWVTGWALYCIQATRLPRVVYMLGTPFSQSEKLHFLRIVSDLMAKYRRF